MNQPIDAETQSPVEWGVFKVNDCDWWLARSPEEARAAAACFYQCRPEDDEIDKEITRLTDTQLAKHKFYEEADRSQEPIPFAEELENRIKAGATVEIFATTEF